MSKPRSLSQGVPPGAGRSDVKLAYHPAHMGHHHRDEPGARRNRLPASFRGDLAGGSFDVRSRAVPSADRGSEQCQKSM